MKKLFSLLLIFIILSLTISDVSAEERKFAAALVVETGIVGEKGGILLGKGKLIFEPGFSYTHVTSNKLDITGFTVLPSLIIGIIQVEKIKRDILVPSMTFKYGITDSFEFDLKIPYFVRHDKIIFGVEPDRVEDKVSESGIGDIEAVILKQLVHEKGAIPDIVSSIKIKSPSGKEPYNLPTRVEGNFTIPEELPLGSGHWAVEPGLTFVKTSDPAILFANISYFWHIKKDVGGIGTVDPGDSINYSLGLAYALNEKLAVSTSFEQKFFTSNTVDGHEQVESDINVASLLFGSSYLFSDKSALNLTFQIGLTPDSPDFQITMQVPISIL